jgi:hypothetical protein
VTTSTLFGQAAPGGTINSGAGNNGTNGLHFNVSAPAVLQRIWHWSSASDTQLPTSIALYTISTLGTSGTPVHSETASWSGAAGSGWVFAAFSSPPALLPGTEYMAEKFRNDATNRWFSYYSVSWPASSGILTAPADEGGVSANSQGWYNIGTALAFANTNSGTAGNNFGMDVEVFVPPPQQRGTRGRPAAARARLRSAGGSPVVIPGNPAPFTLPAVLKRAHSLTRRARLGASPGSPAVPLVPAPFALPETLRRANSILRKSRLGGSPGSPVVPLVTPPFTPPRKPVRGGPAARKGRLSGSPGSPAVVPPALPSPFSLPGLRRGKAAVCRARLAQSAGAPYSPPGATVAGTWVNSYAVGSGFYFPAPAAVPLQVTVANTAGDWLFAVVAWRQAEAGAGVSAVVADDAHNWWEPVGAPNTDSAAAGTVRVSVWAAPAARVANPVTGQTFVQVAPTGPVLALGAVIIDMAGLQPWYQVAAINTAYANGVTSLSVSSAAPSAQALLFAGFAGDNNTYTIGWPAGWHALPGTVNGNGTDHTADIALVPAWQVTTAAASAVSNATGTLDMAGVIAGVLVSAPAPSRPSADWPVMITEAAPGAGVQTPPAQVTWTDISSRVLSMSMGQGRQYTLSQLTAGQGTMTMDNPDGALIPPGTGIYSGIDSGTPVRRRVIIPASHTPHYIAASGYFRRLPWNMDTGTYRGQTQAELCDIWAYANVTLNSMAVEECLLDSPRSLWPLTDAAGSTGGSNLAPGNSLALAQAVSKYGAGGATAAWGTNTTALVGATSGKTKGSVKTSGSSGMWQQTLAGTSLAYNGYGYCLQCTDTAFPSISGGVTAECFAESTVTAAVASVNGNGVFVATAGASPAFKTQGSNFPNGMPVILAVATGFTFPSPFTAGTVYYVTNSDGQGGYDLSAAQGGSAIACTVSGDGYNSSQLAWDPVVMSLRDGSGAVAGLSVRNTDGALLLVYRTPSGAASQVVSTAGQDFRAGGPYHFSLSLTQTAWRVLVSAGGVLTASGTFASPLPASFRELCVAGVQDSTQQGYAYPGYAGFAGVYPGFSAQSRVVSRYWATGAGMTDESAMARTERILEYAGLAGRRWLGIPSDRLESDLVASGRDIGGQAAASAAGNIAQSTLPAMLAVAPTGDIFYLSKPYAWNQPVRWTLGTDAAAGEIPFAPKIATDYDPSRVTEDVQLSNLDTQAVTVPSGVTASTTMAAVAAATERQYGGQAYQQTHYLISDWSSAYGAGSSAVDLANWLANIYSKPANRVQAITVNAVANSANVSSQLAWQFWAGAAPGDMVQVNVRVPTAVTSPLVSMTARITQTQRKSQYAQGAVSATIACVLDFAPEYSALTCDDPVRGLLGGANVMPWLRPCSRPRAPGRRTTW